MLSILIPSYHKEELLYYGLLSIRQQHLSLPYEILVLNDGLDSDGTCGVCDLFKDLNLRYMFVGHRNISSPSWRCPGFVLNIAVKSCVGEVLLLQQPEIYYRTKNCIADMVSAAQASPLDMISPTGILDSGRYLTCLRAGHSIDTVVGEGTPLEVRLPFCMAMQKSLFTSIGGYDEDFVGYCFDDTDFIERLEGSGSRLQILDKHEVIHLHHPRTPKYRLHLKDRDAAWNYNRLLYESKRGSIVRNVGKSWGRNE